MKLTGEDSSNLVIHRDGTWKRTRGGKVIEDGSLYVDGKNKIVNYTAHSGPNKGQRRRGTYSVSGSDVRIKLKDGRQVSYKLADNKGTSYVSSSDNSTLKVSPDGSFTRSRNHQQLDAGHIELDSAHGIFRLHYNSGSKSGQTREGHYDSEDGEVSLKFADGGSASFRQQ